MAGSVVPVPPGPPTQISGSNLLDTTIYNMDSTYAIWVGNSPSVTPNNGMRIGPLGTAAWAKSQGLCYICQDKAVPETNPPYIINVNTTNDVNDVANPVDVATATAIAVFNSGVPSVDVPKTVPLDGSWFDVTSYSSLDINIVCNDLTNPNGNALEDIWFCEVNYINDPDPHVYAAEFFSGHSQGNAQITLPTRGTRMSISLVMNNVSTDAYSFTNSSAIVSYRPKNVTFKVHNVYWDTFFGTDDAGGNAYGNFSQTNTSLIYHPSYTRGQQNIGFLLNSGGTAGAIVEMAVMDASTGLWLTGILSISGVNSFFEQLECNFYGQPRLFVKNTSTTSQNFQYSQVAI